VSVESCEMTVNVGDWVVIDPGYPNVGGVSGRVLEVAGHTADVVVADAGRVAVECQFLLFDQHRKRRTVEWARRQSDRFAR
jgi:ribosomal protein L24